MYINSFSSFVRHFVLNEFVCLLLSSFLTFRSLTFIAVFAGSENQVNELIVTACSSKLDTARKHCLLLFLRNRPIHPLGRALRNSFRRYFVLFLFLFLNNFFVFNRDVLPINTNRFRSRSSFGSNFPIVRNSKGIPIRFDSIRFIFLFA